MASGTLVCVALTAGACGGDGLVAPHPSLSTEASTGSYSAVRTWTLILRDTAGRIGIAQTDPNAPPGTTGIWPASFWSRLDSAPAARNLTLRTWLVAHRDQGAAGRVSVQLRWALEDQGTVLATGDAPLRADRLYGVLRARGQTTGNGEWGMGNAGEGGGGGPSAVSAFHADPRAPPSADGPPPEC